MALEFLFVSRQEFRINLIFIIFQLHIAIKNSSVEQTAAEFYNNSSWKSDQNYAQNRKNSWTELFLSKNQIVCLNFPV